MWCVGEQRVCVRSDDSPHSTMTSKISLMRVRKELLVRRVQEQAGAASALVAVASIGNISSADKFRIRYGLQDTGAAVNFTKNTLVAKALERLGPDAMGLAPLLRGKTIIASGPAEVPLAKQLLSFEKALPGFHVLGALLNSQRILQVRRGLRTGGERAAPATHPRSARFARSCATCRCARSCAQAHELDRLSKLPALDVVHTQMVSQMLPGTCLQVPNVAAYLVSVLQTHVDAQQEGSA